jgi:hypothetical protein
VGDGTVVQHPQTIERTECGFAHCWAGVRHPAVGAHPVAQVSGDDDRAAAFGDAAIERLSGELAIERFRGRLCLPRSAGSPSAVVWSGPFRWRSVFGARSRHHITMTEP